LIPFRERRNISSGGFMTRIAASKLRSETVRRMAKRGRRIVLQSRGKDVAVLVPIDQLRRLEDALEEMQDQIDADEAVKILAEMEAKGEKAIPWEQVQKELGLK
jgi:antitoxin (DNA-binding transcriptional repressor) of toxin-antitoxin stability system